MFHRSRMLGLSFLGILVLGAMPADSSRAAAPDHELRILFNSSVQGKLHDCGCKGNPLGGIARRAALLAELSEAPAATLLLDGGNLLPPTQGKDAANAEFVAEATQELGYQWVGVGPREIARGIANSNPLFAQSGLDFVCANLRSASVAEMRVVQRGDLRVAFTSVVSPDLARAVQADVPVIDPVEALRRVLPRMRAQADLVVVACAVESGRTASLMAALDPVLAPDVAIISQGNAHLSRVRQVGATAVVAANSQGKYLGQLDLWRDESGSWHIESTVHPLGLALPEDPAVAAAVTAFEAARPKTEVAESTR